MNKHASSLLSSDPPSVRGTRSSGVVLSGLLPESRESRKKSCKSSATPIVDTLQPSKGRVDTPRVGGKSTQAQQVAAVAPDIIPPPPPPAPPVPPSSNFLDRTGGMSRKQWESVGQVMVTYAQPKSLLYDTYKSVEKPIKFDVLDKTQQARCCIHWLDLQGKEPLKSTVKELNTSLKSRTLTYRMLGETEWRHQCLPTRTVITTPTGSGLHTCIFPLNAFPSSFSSSLTACFLAVLLQDTKDLVLDSCQVTAAPGTSPAPSPPPSPTCSSSEDSLPLGFCFMDDDIHDDMLHAGQGRELVEELRSFVYTVGTYGGACSFTLDGRPTDFDFAKRDLEAVGLVLHFLHMRATAAKNLTKVDLTARAMREVGKDALLALENWWGLDDTTHRPPPPPRGQRRHTTLKMRAHCAAHEIQLALKHIAELQRNEQQTREAQLQQNEQQTREVRAFVGGCDYADSDEENEINIRSMLELYEDSPSNAWWDE